jgi:hypothetical protein
LVRWDCCVQIEPYTHSNDQSTVRGHSLSPKLVGGPMSVMAILQQLRRSVANVNLRTIKHQDAPSTYFFRGEPTPVISHTTPQPSWQLMLVPPYPVAP